MSNDSVLFLSFSVKARLLPDELVSNLHYFCCKIEKRKPTASRSHLVMEGDMTTREYSDEFPLSIEQEMDNIEADELNDGKAYTAISRTRSERKPCLKIELAVHVALAIGASSFLGQSK